VTIEKVARAMSWSLFGRAAAFIAGIAANIMIVRGLSDSDWGVLSEIRTILAYVYVLVMLGLDSALLKYLPALRVGGGVPHFVKTVRWLILLQVGVWGALLALSRFGGGGLNGFFRQPAGSFSFYLQLGVCFVIFEIFMAFVTTIYQSWYETKRLAAVVIGGNILYVAALVTTLRLGWGIPGVLVSSAVMNLSMVIVLLPHVRSLLRSAQAGAADPIPAGAILGFSLPLVMNGLLNQVVWRQSEVIFLGHFWGAKVAGYFSLAYRNPQLMLEFVPLTIWPLVLAGMSEFYARDEKNLPRSVDLYYRLIYLLVVPIAAMGFAFARPLVPLLFGAKMLPAALVTQLFFVVFSYSFLYTPLSMALYVIGKSWVNMVVFLCLAILNIGLDLAFIPRYGLWGAFAPITSVLVIEVIAFNRVVRRFRPDVQVPFGFVARCYAAAVPAALVGFISYRWSSPLELLCEFVVALALLVAGFRVAHVVGPNERELIMRLPVPFKRQLVAIF
jgi:O-antigen/teichoic acid export membrane protein